MMTVRRRRLLALAAGTVAVAGCVGEAAPSGDDEDHRIDPPTIGDDTIYTTGADCGTDEYATVEFGDTTVQIAGHITAPNPCHDAVLTAVELDGGRLVVVVDVTPTDQDVCIECVGEIGYEATIEVTPADRLREVEVKHGSRVSFTYAS